MSKKLKIVFIGGHQRTIKTFKELIKRKDIEIIFFIIQKDYKNEFKHYLELKKLAIKNKISYVLTESSKKLKNSIVKKVQKISPDVILRGGNWRAMLPPEIWNTAKYGCIGLHGSSLPKYRGWAGINWHLINGEKQYGLQMFRFNKSIDDGDLVYRKNGSSLSKKISLNNKLSISQILEKVDFEHVRLIMELVSLLKFNKIKFKKQNISRQTWTCHRGPEDGQIDWKQNTTSIYNFIRGQSYPFPGAFTFYKSKKLYIWNSEIKKKTPKYVGRIPGKIININKENGTAEVLTGDGVLIIKEVTYGREKYHPLKRFQFRKLANNYLNSVREKLGLNIYEELIKLKKKYKN